MPAGIVTRHRAHQDGRVWLHLHTKKSEVSVSQGQRVPARGQESPGGEAHLCVHDVGQVEWLLHDGHEGLAEVRGDEQVGHGQQAVGAESLDQEQAVDGLPDGR